MLISQELLSQIKKIQIKSDRMASEILSGEYKSAFKGKGLNFESIREYQIGDDIRGIDWKVTARMQEPYIRQYKEERQLSIIVILDLSASNDFGTQRQTKQEMAVELASVLASLAIKSNDKVGMILITDEVESYIPPKQGKAHIFRLIKDLLTFKPKSKKTNLKRALQEVISMVPKHSVVFLISDFIKSKAPVMKELTKQAADDVFAESFDYEKELKLLRKTQDLIAISIRDPREFWLPNIGFVEVINPETGQKQLLNLNRKSTRELFAHLQSDHINRLSAKFKRLGIDFLDLSTHKPYLQTLLHMFLTKERRS
ncbi:MAG: DUF58 domain-containing protein [Candidatus Melainabacteria bacterium]|nr:DUF58 domain-containing protein [Candidatus Melainabacteria bacterium]